MVGWKICRYKTSKLQLSGQNYIIIINIIMWVALLTY